MLQFQSLGTLAAASGLRANPAMPAPGPATMGVLGVVCGGSDEAELDPRLLFLLYHALNISKQ